MSFLVGVDVGTSSLKTIITDETGNVYALRSCDYQFDMPHQGWAEQNPDVWYDAFADTMKKTLSASGIDKTDIAAVGFSGQMHGAVMLDENMHSVRPAILHCDVRSGDIVEDIKRILPVPEQYRLMKNPVYCGFLLVSLLWVREHEPENFARIRHVCLPKDYVKYRLSGEWRSDCSDASATLVFDIENRIWSEEILRRFDLPVDWFPQVTETTDMIGAVTGKASRETGLPAGTAVVSGGGDQVMQAIGSGAIDEGAVSINIGTSGQVSVQSMRPALNPALSTNVFCGFACDRWITMGAIMNAGLCLKWWRGVSGQVDFDSINVAVAKVSPGSDGIIFLPYLNGERTPHLNPDLSGAFLGLRLQSGMPEMTRAVMEGVTYALRECMILCESLGLSVQGDIISSGGGARSDAWLQIQADVFGRRIRVAENAEQAALGAAIAAGVGSAVFKSTKEGCLQMVRYKDLCYEPVMAHHALYEEFFELYRAFYRESGNTLAELTRIGRG